MKLLSVALLMAVSIFAADEGEAHSSKRTWIRRATLVAGCAASILFDSMTTRRAVAAGGIETNGLLADPQGHPLWGRMIGIKASVCGASAMLQETHVFGAWRSPAADWTWTGMNAAAASVYTWGGIHNLKLAKDLSRGNF